MQHDELIYTFYIRMYYTCNERLHTGSGIKTHIFRMVEHTAEENADLMTETCLLFPSSNYRREDPSPTLDLITNRSGFFHCNG